MSDEFVNFSSQNMNELARNVRKFVNIDEKIFNFAQDSFKNGSTKTTARLHRLLASYMSSIGRISCGNVQGTCWLVTDTLVITNHHVYMCINKEREELQNFNLPITVSFDYFYRGQTEDVVTVEVDEERDPELENSYLDYKFLRLRECYGLRDRVPLGSIVRSRSLQKGLVIIVGHPQGKEMHEETCVVVSRHSWREKLTQRCNSIGRIHMMNSELPHAFERYECCLPYDTSLFAGSSGSPVFDMNGNIVAMHTQGHTVNVAGVKCSLMEFGVEFGAICENMQRRYNAVEQFFPNCDLRVDEELPDIIDELQAHPLKYREEVTRRHELEIQQREQAHQLRYYEEVTRSRDLEMLQREQADQLRDHEETIERLKLKIRQRSRDPNSCYPMERPPYGFALIINIESFNGMDERCGSDVDVKKQEKLWKQFGFTVETHVDLEAHRICTVVQDMAVKIKSVQSCFVCCIMTHGDMGVIYGSDSEPVEIKYIIDLFKEDKCSALAGKPKLFFIQACRGSQGRPPAMPEITPTPALDSNALSEADGDVDYDHVNELTFRHSADPSEPDFLIGYSTVADHASFRDTAGGTFYVDALVEIFSKYHTDEGILMMITRINAKVAKRYKEMGYKQCPAPIHTLTKDIYFSSIA